MTYSLLSVAMAAMSSVLSAGSAPGDTCESWAMTGDIRTAPGEAAEAVLISGERVTAVGDASLADALPAECVVALPEGAVALPGLHDGHAHLLGVGLREMTLNLEGTTSIAELQTRIKSAAAELDKCETLYGRGWIETGWPEGRMPTAADLDKVVKDRPVILVRADGHAMVVNTMALKRAGITKDTADPEGGRVERDEKGKATGLLIDMAMPLVDDLLPKLDEDRRREGLKVGAEKMASLGWTGVHNMSVNPEDVVILKEMSAAGELPVRVFNYLVPGALDQVIEQGTGCTDDDMVCTNGIKFYVDGALGSRGALLFHDYADQPGKRGLQLMQKEDAVEAFQKAYENKVQVTTHAIGDKGNFLVLDWYKRVLGELDATERKAPRWRIEHAQIVRPNDIPRFAFYGITPSMQPSHAIGDLFFAPARLGEQRLLGAYAWGRFFENGANVVGGSDAPVEKGDPRIEIFAATKRKALDGTQGENWHPEEAVTEEQAIAMFTTNAAYAVFKEDRLGRLAEGFYADISVFSGDPFETDWNATNALMTVVGGKVR
ncbi:amidohydrolase [Parvularcula marina]|nr:amidohydrolase [Parvularcula marina]